MNSTVQLNEERSASVLPYICWLVVLGLGFWNLVYIREVAISILIVCEIDPKILLLLDKLGFFLFAVGGLLIILLSEPYLRNGWKQSCLTIRFLKCIVGGLAVLSVTWAILMALPGLADAARPTVLDLALSAGFLILCAALLSRRLPQTEGQSVS